MNHVPQPATEQAMRATFQYRGVYRTATVPPAIVSYEDLQRLYRDLDAKTQEALEKHLATLVQPANMNAEQFEALKTEARRVGTLTVTIQGARGEQIVSSTGDVLTKEQLPDVVSWIAFDSGASLRTYNVTLLNRFNLHLDFTEPPGFEKYDPWDQSTPNNSKLEVIGDDNTWTTAVYESALEFFRRRSKRRRWLHSHVSFNALNWLVGFPAALWIVYRIDSSALFADLHTALKGAIYVYVFLVGLAVFRAILWGFRWIFPLLELEGARSMRTRIAVGGALSSLLIALVYDVLRTLFA